MRNKIDETINTYNNVVREYIEYFNSKDLHGEVQFQKEIDILVKYLEDGSRILDVGTAIGDYPKYLTEKCNKNFDVTGIDAAEEMIKVAINSAPKAKFKVMDMRKLDFPDKYFNAIICFATLHHVDDASCLSILKRFNSILKDNGIIIINVMEHINGKKETYIKEPLNPKYNTFINKYSKSFFVDWFKNNNYDILKIIDNPLFNPNIIKQLSVDTNQFSIIAKKNIN